jgi:hypothetical protein
MKKILNSLYNNGHRSRYEEEKYRISQNMINLKKSLNKQEKILLLRICDDNDLIIEKASIDSFINGVNIGAKLMLEILYHN